MQPSVPASEARWKDEYERAVALVRNGEGAAALRILERLAHQGYGHAHALRGTVFDFGLAGVEANASRAASDYQMAIDLCGANAAVRGMAKLLYLGRGIRQDLHEAFRYYHACALHTPDKMCRLATGLMLANGQGTHRDEAAALPFLEEAAQHGYLEAHDALVSIHRNSGHIVQFALALLRRSVFKSRVFRGKRQLVTIDWNATSPGAPLG